MPTRAREVADVSGAGDTVIAALAIGLACGAGAAARRRMLANVAAGISVGKPGTATVGHGELTAALHRRELLALDDKVVELDAAARCARVARRRAARRLHQRLLRPHPSRPRPPAAPGAAACDRLIVGLNSDASVRRLKGPDRPVQPEMARATVMAAIASVDLVVLFEEDTPEAVIRALRPDLLFKGADYRSTRWSAATSCELRRRGAADRPGSRALHNVDDAADEGRVNGVGQTQPRCAPSDVLVIRARPVGLTLPSL